MAAIIARTARSVLGLALLVLALWATVLALSLPFVNAPAAVLPGLIVLSLPLFGVLGVELWRQGSRRSATLAYQDDLTELGNRRAFRSMTGERLREARSGSLAMILIDVDQLKLVNDECGHQAGDELLSLLARRLQKIAPDPDLVFRFGGDEFALLVDRASGQAAAEVIAKLGPFATAFATCGHEHRINISYGYVSNFQDETFNSLFSRADQRLREVKRQIYKSDQLSARPFPAQTETVTDAFTAKVPSPDERRFLHRRRVTP